MPHIHNGVVKPNYSPVNKDPQILPHSTKRDDIQSVVEMEANKSLKPIAL